LIIIRFMQPSIALIAALSDNQVIGQDNRLPWNLPADLQHFKSVTLDKPIIMGRRTWESLPGLLPRRRHILLTGDRNYRAAGCILVHSIEEALEAAGDAPEVMVIGGQTLYQQMLPLADRLYLTRVHTVVQGDAFFPGFATAEWREVAREDHRADARNPFDYSFITLERF